MNATTQPLKRASRGGIVWGVITIFCGLLSIGSPLVSGLAVAIMAGVVLLVAGAAMTIYAFQAPSLGRGILKLLFGTLTVLVGISAVSNPSMALVQLTLLLGLYFIADGVVSMIIAFNIKPDPGWGWVTFSGAASIALGWMIMRGWPLSGVWAIGVLVGVRLLLAGTAMLTMGAAGGRVARDMQSS